MNRDQFKTAYSATRSDKEAAWSALWYTERKIIARVFDNKRPWVDQLAYRARKKKAFGQLGVDWQKMLKLQYKTGLSV